MRLGKTMEIRAVIRKERRKGNQLCVRYLRSAELSEAVHFQFLR